MQELPPVGGDLSKAMKRGKRAEKRRRWPLVLLLAALALLAALFFLRSTAPEPPAPEVEDTPAQIAIPGYEGLTLQAGAKKQSLRLANPKENDCYFQISLYLADDTLLWQSDLIKPGKTSAPITLSRPLAPGAYPGATLRYACFRLDREKTPLNGAETKLTLWVQ